MSTSAGAAGRRRGFAARIPRRLQAERLTFDLQARKVSAQTEGPDSGLRPGTRSYLFFNEVKYG